MTNSRSISVGGHALGGLRALAIFAVVWILGLVAPAVVLWVYQEATSGDFWHAWPAMAAMGAWWCGVMILLAAGVIWGRQHLTLTKPIRVVLGLIVAATGVATVIYYIALSDGSTGPAIVLFLLLGTGAILLGGVVDLSLGPWEKGYDSRHVTP
ncbi:hypothetical protein [Nocardioides montaniterrae]